MAERRVKSSFVKAVIIFGLVFGGFYLFMKYKDVILPQGRQPGSILSDEAKGTAKSGTPVIKVGVVTYPGYAGAYYMNGGLPASTASRFYKEYGILVDFKIIDDVPAAREAWKNEEVDVLASTQDMMPMDASGLYEYGPKVFIQASWSRGADVFVAKYDIKSIRDLRGKKVAVCLDSPSHSFLMLMLQADEMEYTEIEIIGVSSTIQAAQYFKNDQVDAAVVWSPDDEECLSTVRGAHVLKSTANATNAIADVFFIRDAFLQKNPTAVTGFYEGWMQGNAEINSNPQERSQAVQILSTSLNLPLDFAESMLGKVRLCTHGDNANFFRLNSDYTGVTGDEIYAKMSRLYTAIGRAPASIPSWRTVSTLSVVQAANLTASIHNAESGFTFTKPTRAEETSPAFSTKALSVTFATGSARLDENGKTIIDIGFADVAREFANNRIRIVGHTDNVGSDAFNQQLSVQRAWAVANYLISKYNSDRNRFIVLGKGSSEPVADNRTEEGRAKNRRTEFQLLGS